MNKITSEATLAESSTCFLRQFASIERRKSQPAIARAAESDSGCGADIVRLQQSLETAPGITLSGGAEP